MCNECIQLVLRVHCKCSECTLIHRLIHLPQRPLGVFAFKGFCFPLLKLFLVTNYCGVCNECIHWQCVCSTDCFISYRDHLEYLLQNVLVSLCSDCFYLRITFEYIQYLFGYLRCELERRMMFSRNVFCGATSPRRPPGILLPTRYAASPSLR